MQQAKDVVLAEASPASLPIAERNQTRRLVDADTSGLYAGQFLHLADGQPRLYTAAHVVSLLLADALVN